MESGPASSSRTLVIEEAARREPMLLEVPLQLGPDGVIVPGGVGRPRVQKLGHALPDRLAVIRARRARGRRLTVLVVPGAHDMLIVPRRGDGGNRRSKPCWNEPREGYGATVRGIGETKRIFGRRSE